AALQASGAVGVGRHFQLTNPTGSDLWLNLGVVPAGAKFFRVLNDKAETVDVNRKVPAEFDTGDRAVALPLGGGGLRVVRVSGPAGVRWQLRPLDGGEQLLLRVSGDVASASFVVRVWALPRDEPALVREVLAAQ